MYVIKVVFRQLLQDHITRTENVNSKRVQVLVAHTTARMLIV